MKVNCIYHSRDLDGFTSGAIVKKKFPDCKLIGYDYGEPIEGLCAQLGQGEMIIMIDVSLPMDGMKRLADIAMGNFVWIDHHASAIQQFTDSAFVNAGPYKRKDEPNYSVHETQKMRAVLKDGLAACEIAWYYFFPDEHIPEGVKMLGEYDTWRKPEKQRWDAVILPFQFGMRAECNSPESFPPWVLQRDGTYHEEALVDAIGRGEAILKYLDQSNELMCRKNAFEIEFQGMRAICCNGGGFNSDFFKSVYDPSRHDVMMPFQFNGKFWTISLYTTHEMVDCSQLAKKMGGGGHRKAAGFQTEDINLVFPNLNRKKS